MNKHWIVWFLLMIISFTAMSQQINRDEEEYLNLFHRAQLASDRNEIIEVIHEYEMQYSTLSKKITNIDQILANLYFRLGDNKTTEEYLSKNDTNFYVMLKAAFYIRIGRDDDAAIIMRNELVKQEKEVEANNGNREKQARIICSLIIIGTLLDEKTRTEMIRRYPLSEEEKRNFSINEMTKEILLDAMWPY